MGFQVMTMTDAAAARVRAIVEISGPDAKGIRVGIKKGGCAGMEYTMERAEAASPGDEVVEQGAARVLIAPTAQMYLFGTEIDYETGMLESGFKFRNPNVTDACGCGESVSFAIAGNTQSGVPKL